MSYKTIRYRWYSIQLWNKNYCILYIQPWESSFFPWPRDILFCKRYSKVNATCQEARFGILIVEKFLPGFYGKWWRNISHSKWYQKTTVTVTKLNARPYLSDTFMGIITCPKNNMGSLLFRKGLLRPSAKQRSAFCLHLSMCLWVLTDIRI